MQISNGKVVTIDYTLTDDDKEVIDSSEGREPLAYIHGAGQIVPGLEKELEGKKPGDAFQVRVEPEDGYGLHDPKKLVQVPRAQIQGDEELKVGMQLHAESPQGQQVVTISRIEGDTVIIDANHPLAGSALIFDIQVREVRDITPEELAHGHVHGPGGHHHH